MKMTELVTNPATLVDQYGKLLVWHLPGILSHPQQVMLPLICNPFLGSQYSRARFGKLAYQWMICSMVHLLLTVHGEWTQTVSRILEHVSLFPGTSICLWHGFSKLMMYVIILWQWWGLMICQDHWFHPELSTTLKPGKTKPCTQKWLKDTAESFALMGTFLRIIHPKLYVAGHQVYQNLIDNPAILQDGDAVLAIWHYWTSQFLGYGIISNCIMPLHHDNYSQGAWYDFLTTVGDYSGSKRSNN
jgi:hypothetical protein